MTFTILSRRLLAIAAVTAILGGGFIAQSYFASPALAACANPGNNLPVGNAGEHPPGGGGDSVTGDRGGSR